MTAQFCYCVTINLQFNPFCFTLGLQMFKGYLVSQNVLLKQERLRSCYQDVRISENAPMNYWIHRRVSFVNFIFIIKPNVEIIRGQKNVPQQKPFSANYFKSIIKENNWVAILSDASFFVFRRVRVQLVIELNLRVRNDNDS